MGSIALIAFLALAAVDWLAVGAGKKDLEFVAKPAALAALLIYAVNGAHASPWLVAALSFSLLGDVYLMLPGNLFAAGLAAFLLGHIAYIVDFHVAVGRGLALLLVVAGASFPVWFRIVRAVDDPRLRAAVPTYIAVILLMVASALGSGSVVAAAGGVFFLVSDSILAWDRFVRPLAWARPATMVTYHLGQLGLVVALR